MRKSLFVALLHPRTSTCDRASYAVYLLEHLLGQVCCTRAISELPFQIADNMGMQSQWISIPPQMPYIHKDSFYPQLLFTVSLDFSQLNRLYIDYIKIYDHC
jgi:hypothetical protein